MIRKVIFNKITFKNFTDNDFNEIILSKGYFVFPAAPALVNIKYEKSKIYVIRFHIAYLFNIHINLKS